MEELLWYVLFPISSETSPTEDLAHCKDLSEGGSGGDALAVGLKIWRRLVHELTCLIDCMSEHYVGGGKVPDQILPFFQHLFEGHESLSKQFLRLCERRRIASIGREQYCLDDDYVHRRHYHAFAEVEPLEILWEYRGVHSGLETSVLMPSKNILSDRARLKYSNIAVFQDWNTSKWMTLSVSPRL